MILKILLTENNYLYIINKYKNSIKFDEGEFLIKNESDLFFLYGGGLGYNYEDENVKVIPEEKLKRKIFIDIPKQFLPKTQFYGKRSAYDLANVNFNEIIHSLMMEDFINFTQLYKIAGFTKSYSVLKFMEKYKFDNSKNQKEYFLGYYRHNTNED